MVEKIDKNLFIAKLKASNPKATEAQVTLLWNNYQATGTLPKGFESLMQSNSAYNKTSSVFAVNSAASAGNEPNLGFVKTQIKPQIQQVEKPVISAEQAQDFSIEQISQNTQSALNLFLAQEENQGIVSKGYDQFKAKYLDDPNLVGKFIKWTLNSNISGTKLNKAIDNEVTGLNFLSQAKEKTLSKREYYEQNKQRLLEMIPDFDTLTEAQKQNIKARIDSLPMQEVKELQHKISMLPNKDKPEYKQEASAMLAEFKSSTETPTIEKGGIEGQQIKTTIKVNKPNSDMNSDELMSYEEVFKYERGAEYSKDKVQTFEEKKAALNFVSGAKQKYEQLKQNADDIDVTDTNVLKLYTEYFGDGKKAQDFLQNIAKEKKLNIQINSNSNGETTLNSTDKSTLKSLLKGGVEAQEAQLNKVLNGKSYEQYQTEYATSYTTAYGTKNAEELATAYGEDQENINAKATGAVQIAGMGSMVIGGVACLIPGAQPIGAGMISVGGKMALGGMVAKTALDVVNESTKKDGMSDEAAKAIIKEAAINAGSFAIGMGAGATGAKVGANLLANGSSKLVSVVAERGVDFTISALGDLAMIGDVNLQGNMMGVVTSTAMGLKTGKNIMKNHLVDEVPTAKTTEPTFTSRNVMNESENISTSAKLQEITFTGKADNEVNPFGQSSATKQQIISNNVSIKTLLQNDAINVQELSTLVTSKIQRKTAQGHEPFLIGNGLEAKVYDLGDCVIRVPKVKKGSVNNELINIDLETIKLVDNDLDGRNFGQPIAKTSNGVTIALKVPGKPLYADLPDNWTSYLPGAANYGKIGPKEANTSFSQMKKMVNLSDEALNEYVKDLNYLKNKGRKVDLVNPNNLLFDEKLGRINILDIKKGTPETLSNVDIINPLINGQHFINNYEHLTPQQRKESIQILKDLSGRIDKLAGKYDFEIEKYDRTKTFPNEQSAILEYASEIDFSKPDLIGEIIGLQKKRAANTDNAVKAAKTQDVLAERLKTATSREDFVTIRDDIKKMQNGQDKTNLIADYQVKYLEWSSNPERPDVRMEHTESTQKNSTKVVLEEIKKSGVLKVANQPSTALPSKNSLILRNARKIDIDQYKVPAGSVAVKSANINEVLLTTGLNNCAGLAIYDKVANTQALIHSYKGTSSADFKKGILDLYPAESFKDAKRFEITVVPGAALDTEVTITKIQDVLHSMNPELEVNFAHFPSGKNDVLGMQNGKVFATTESSRKGASVNPERRLRNFDDEANRLYDEAHKEVEVGAPVVPHSTAKTELEVEVSTEMPELKSVLTIDSPEVEKIQLTTSEKMKSYLPGNDSYQMLQNKKLSHVCENNAQRTVQGEVNKALDHLIARVNNEMKIGKSKGELAPYQSVTLPDGTKIYRNSVDNLQGKIDRAPSEIISIVTPDGKNTMLPINSSGNVFKTKDLLELLSKADGPKPPITKVEEPVILHAADKIEISENIFVNKTENSAQSVDEVKAKSLTEALNSSVLNPDLKTKITDLSRYNDVEKELIIDVYNNLQEIKATGEEITFPEGSIEKLYKSGKLTEAGVNAIMDIGGKKVISDKDYNFLCLQKIKLTSIDSDFIVNERYYTVTNGELSTQSTSFRSQAASIIKNEYAKLKQIPQEGKVVIVSGHPASGKSTATSEVLGDTGNYFNADPDQYKELFTEYNNGLGTDVVHRASGEIRDRLLENAIVNKRNLIIETTGSSLKTNKFIKKFQDAGYEVEVVHINRSPGTCAEGIVSRAEKPPYRVVPPEILLLNAASQDYTTIPFAIHSSHPKLKITVFDNYGDLETFKNSKRVL